MAKNRNFQVFSLLFIALLYLPHNVLAIELQGSFIQGGMVRGHVGEQPVSEIWLNETPVKIGPNGYFVFGFSRDEAAKATLKTIYSDGSLGEKILDIKAQTYNIERVDGLPPRTVNIPEAEKIRRSIERRKVGVARSFINEEHYWRENFIQPAKGRISGVYGSQRILNGSPRTPHYGLDVAAPIGTQIVAPASGVVRLAEPDFLLEGGIVIIDHGFSIFSTLFHMNSVSVVEGQMVAKGEPIGTIGKKGRASGPHVDWRINWGKVRLDPKLLLENE
jgi:murein DD-endopeptidase MepM/ murein hydrolase activator NlpD